MKELCTILDKKKISYDWYVLGSAFKPEDYNEITGWFKENKNVHFLGYKSNVYPYIKQMDYLALLTDREAWGLVITEALILGIPSIVTNFEGVERQITDRKNGIILNMNNDENSYEKRVEDIISLKNELKENVNKEDYNREQILNYWNELLKL